MNTSPQQTAPHADPFDEWEKVPSLSWATAQPGTVVQGVISRLPREVHDVDIATREPKYWKNGNPQMTVVLHLDIPSPTGLLTRSVWAKKPSSLYRALGEAQKTSGAKFAIGGTLAIRLERFEPSKTPGFNPQKIYAAKYQPPADPTLWQDEEAQPSALPAPSQAPGQATIAARLLCQHRALPQGPRPAQADGLCGNVAAAVLAGQRICQIHKAMAEAQAHASPPSAAQSSW